MNTIQTILDNFTSAFERGEDPNPQDYLSRITGRDRFVLGEMIDRYLEHDAPPRGYHAGTFAAARATPLMEAVAAAADASTEPWPKLLPRLRQEAKIKRAALVDGLAARLGLAGSERLVGEAYHEMEQGHLTSADVDRSVLEALGELLGTTADALRAAGRAAAPTGASGPALGSALARTAQPAEAHDLGRASRTMPEPSDAEARARVDALFRRGGEGL